MSSLKVIQVCDHQGPLPDGKTLGKDEEDESSSSSQTRRGLIKIYDIQKRLQLLLCSVCTDGKRYSTIENGNNKERERFLSSWKLFAVAKVVFVGRHVFVFQKRRGGERVNNSNWNPFIFCRQSWRRWTRSRVQSAFSCLAMPPLNKNWNNNSNKQISQHRFYWKCWERFGEYGVECTVSFCIILDAE